MAHTASVGKSGRSHRFVQASRRRPNSQTRSSAFTLVEVVLAVVIAIGILAVALFFYQQSANLRTQLIEETERISSVRLLMDKITAELQTAQSSVAFPSPLTGASNSIQFVKTDLPVFSDWNGGTLGRAATPVTDLRKVSYRLAIADGTNVLGLARTEEPLVEIRRLVPEMPNIDLASDTNQPPETTTGPIFDTIRFLRFRYWNGTEWQDDWNASQLPRGIEVTMGSRPAAEGMETNEISDDIFRRIISIPASGSEQTRVSSSDTEPAADPFALDELP